MPRFGGRGRALEGREHDGLTAERALAVGALPPEEGPAGQPAAPGAAGGGAQVSGAAGKGFGEWEAGCLFQGLIGRCGVAARTAPTDVHPGLLEKPVPSTTIGSRSRLER